MRNLLTDLLEKLYEAEPDQSYGEGKIRIRQYFFRFPSMPWLIRANSGGPDTSIPDPPEGAYIRAVKMGETGPQTPFGEIFVSFWLSLPGNPLACQLRETNELILKCLEYLDDRSAFA